MSELISALLSTSCADRELLISNEGLGDIATTAREVEFLLIAPNAKKANLIARFINDNRYGDAVAKSDGDSHQIVVSIMMPITQNAVFSAQFRWSALQISSNSNTMVGRAIYVETRLNESTNCSVH
ncbi:MAG: hypothetical protein R3C20_04740 [Planctomycetaceae bacterium]